MNIHFRKMMILASLVVSLTLGFQTPTRAALIQLSSNSGEVRDLIQTNTSTLFAATQGGGIYNSTDAGSSWTRLSGLTERYVWRLASHPSNPQLLYAATGSGLFKSPDGGVHWNQITFDNVHAVAIDPSNQNHLLIGVPGAGVYISNDGGNTFSLSNSGLDSLDVTAIAFDPYISGVVYVGLNSNVTGGWGGVFKSTDGGITWLSWNNPNSNGALGNKFVTALVVDNGGSVYVGTYNPGSNLGGLYKQTGSNGWNSQNPQYPYKEVYGVEAIVIDKSTQGRLWAGTRSFGPWVSNDNGNHWQQAVDPSIDYDVYSGVYSLLTFSGSPGKVLIGVKGLGLYQTLNSGSSWNETGSGITADRARAIAAYPPTHPTTFYLGLSGGGVMRSLDSGTNWVDFNNGLAVLGIENNLTVSQLACSSTGPNNIYAATFGRGLFKWNGTSWVRVAESGLPNDQNSFLKPMGLVVDPSDDRVVFYSLFDSGQGVYRRDASSGTWSLVRPGSFSGAGASKIVMTPAANRLYALMFDELPYKSTGGGYTGTWTQVTATSAGFMRLSFNAVAENPLNPNTVLASTNKGLLKSTDGGNNWVKVDPISGLGSTILSGLVFSPTVSGRVWAVDRSGAYYCSNDNGTTWTVLNDPLLGSAIVDMKLIDGALYLVTDGNGILKDAAPVCP